ncbi:MAG: energy-coupling factor ABC transporter permease, partial [Desulfobacterales bacterium]|nr:energy-coupling factor ABC transporter permease [Desulfobacterales bacterium]
MHMADALISPSVGCSMLAVTGAVILYSSKKIKEEFDDSRIPLMGVLGAFVFAAQMINFTIPLTGSSGHIGGGILLAILIGPYSAFLTITSILTIQALLFADGGILALGCNIFNLGFLPCFVSYPFVYKNIVKEGSSKTKIFTGATIASVLGLQLGALGVVLETVFSEISILPFDKFLILMLPIHLAIGIVEGLVTATIVTFILNAKPDINAYSYAPSVKKNIFAIFIVAALFTAGFFSWFASSLPDGLEWSISNVTVKEEISSKEEKIYSSLSNLQEKTSFFPDYNFKNDKEQGNIGTSVAGLIGVSITFI